MAAKLIVPETVEKWHSPEIPVIATRAQPFGQYGFYLLQGEVRVGGGVEAFNNGAGSSGRYDRKLLLIRVKFPDGERKINLALNCGGSPENKNANTLVELLKDIPASGLEGAVGIHYRNAGSRVANYIWVDGVLEAVIKGWRVTQIYAPPVYASPASAAQPVP